MKGDPGARIGGNTVVATGKGEQVYAVPDRANFVLALGVGGTVHGAAKGDQLGALGKGVKIIAPRGGHALIEGGPEGTIVVAGKGHDIVVEHKAGATIEVKSPDDEVVAAGPHDRVLCSGRVKDETIVVGKSDIAGAGCRGHGDTIEFSLASHSALAHTAPRAHAAALEGTGSYIDPYVETTCVSVSGGICKFAFPTQTLTGLWANDYVPAYKCNSTYPYLYNHAYTAQVVPRGVDITVSTGSVGVTIYRASVVPGSYYAGGTPTGFLNSSATNWAIGESKYRVDLFCTNNPDDGYLTP